MFLPNCVLLLLALPSPPDTLTDDQIVAMGHERYIAQQTAHAPGNLDIQGDAERSYGMALTRVNERIMAASPNKAELKEIQMYLANITKVSMRKADAFTDGTPQFGFYIRRAEVSVSRALHGYLVGAKAEKTLTQQEVWTAYTKGKDFLDKNRDRLVNYASRGGYGIDQHELGYKALGDFFVKVFTIVADSTPDQKKIMFRYAREMIYYTAGHDPLSDTEPDLSSKLVVWQ